MIKIDIKIDTDQTVEIVECHIEVEFSMDKIIEEECSLIKILGEAMLEECKIIEVRILEVDIEVTLEMITLEKVQVGLEKDSIHVVLEDMSKVVIGPDQVQELLLIEIGYNDLNVGSMIILTKDCLNISDAEKEQSEQIQQMPNLKKTKQH